MYNHTYRAAGPAVHGRRIILEENTEKIPVFGAAENTGIYNDLHVHSMYSMRDAVSRIKDIVAASVKRGSTAVALTDHGNMHGVLELYKACAAANAEAELKNDPHRIKAILGVEMYVLPELSMLDDPETKHIKNHIIFLAKDAEGYRQCSKAVTAGQKHKDKGQYPRVTHDEIREIFTGGHTVCLSACVQGEVPVLIRKGKLKEAEETALFYRSVFGDDYYLELQDHGLTMEAEYTGTLIEMGHRLGIPLVVTNDCHYVTQADIEARDMVRAMRFGRKLDEQRAEEPDCAQLYMKSYSEMASLFPDCPEAVENTVKIAEKCNFVLEKKKHFPQFRVPAGFASSEAYIRWRAEKAFPEKYPADRYTPEELRAVKERMEYELGVICDLHYDGYLLIVSDFIEEGKKHGLIGPGRGSAVGSVVCYLLSITSVEPMQYSLIFERFLNKDRVSDPDIDTDFAPALRAVVIAYVKKIYGADAVCQIVTFGTLAARGAIKAVGRVRGIDKTYTDRVAKLVPAAVGMNLTKALHGTKDNPAPLAPELAEEMRTNADARILVEKAFLLEGLVVQTGIHAAGVIIADRAVSEYCPLSYDEKKQLWITQYAKDSCEHDCGLLKMDFLGLENLNIIGGTFRDVEKNRGIKLTMASIDERNAKEVREVLTEIFTKGQTKGVFQFESSGMTSYLERLKPQRIEDLILLNAAYRPGPMQYIDEIISIKNGEKKARYICPEMEKIFGVTFSKPIYQEQVQQAFHEVGGFSLGVADIIRRAMAKKHLDELQNYLPKFKDALKAKDVSQEDADSFCEELIDFAKYAFNKSHATAYTIVAYQTAWLKYYYPVEYMANLLTSTSQVKPKKLPLYINECKRMGIPVLPPDVNVSGMDFTPTRDGKILFGLRIKNTGVSGEDIIAERTAGGPFKDLGDFCRRMIAVKGSRVLYAGVASSYAKSGAFDGFGRNRRTVAEGIAAFADAMKKASKKETDAADRAENAELLKPEAAEIASHFAFLCSADGLYSYAKAMKKAKGLTENARGEEELSGKKAPDAEAAEFAMQSAFPAMFAPQTGYSDAELRDALCRYAEIYPLIKRLGESAEKTAADAENAFRAAELCLSSDIPEYARQDLLAAEKDLLGFYASGHPLEGMREYINSHATVLIGELDEQCDGLTEKLVGRITEKKMLYRKTDHAPMCKFTLEGLTGDIECICFTKAYAESGPLLNEGSVVALTGTVQADTPDLPDTDQDSDSQQAPPDPTFEFHVMSAETVTVNERIYIRCDNMEQWKGLRDRIFDKCGGNERLFVFFDDTKRTLECTRRVSDYESVRAVVPEMIEMKMYRG